MIDITTIKIKQIPGLFVDASFEDRNYFEAELVQVPIPEIQEFETQIPFATVNDAQTRVRKVQAIVYKVFEIEVLSNQTIEIENFKLGNEITILDTQNILYDAKLLEDVDTQVIDSTYRYLHSIKFIILQDDTRSVINYFDSTYMFELYDNTINTLTLSSDPVLRLTSLIIKTPLMPFVSRKELKKETITKETGEEYTLQYNDVEVWKVTFYLSAEVLRQFKTMVQRAFFTIDGVIWGAVLKVPKSNKTITSQLPVTFEETDESTGLIDLYRVDCEIYTDIQYYEINWT